MRCVHISGVRGPHNRHVEFVRETQCQDAVRLSWIRLDEPGIRVARNILVHTRDKEVRSDEPQSGSTFWSFTVVSICGTVLAVHVLSANLVLKGESSVKR